MARATVSIGRFGEVVQHGAPPPRKPDVPSPETEAALWNQKDFARIWVFDFGARRKSADVHVTLVRSIRAGNKASLVRNGNAVRDIAAGWFHLGSRGRGLRFRFDRYIGRRRRRAGLIRLRLRRILPLRWRSPIPRRARARGTHGRFVFAS